MISAANGRPDALQATFEAAKAASDTANNTSLTAYKRSNKLLHDQLKRSQLLSDHRVAMRMHKEHITTLVRHTRLNTTESVIANVSAEINTIFAESANTADVAHDVLIMLAGFQLYRMKLREFRMEELLVKKQGRCMALVKEAERRRTLATEKKEKLVVIGKALEDGEGGNAGVQ